MFALTGLRSLHPTNPPTPRKSRIDSPGTRAVHEPSQQLHSEEVIDDSTNSQSASIFSTSNCQRPIVVNRGQLTPNGTSGTFHKMAPLLSNLRDNGGGRLAEASTRFSKVQGLTSDRVGGWAGASQASSGILALLADRPGIPACGPESAPARCGDGLECPAPRIPAFHPHGLSALPQLDTSERVTRWALSHGRRRPPVPVRRAPGTLIP